MLRPPAGRWPPGESPIPRPSGPARPSRWRSCPESRARPSSPGRTGARSRARACASRAACREARPVQWPLVDWDELLRHELLIVSGKGGTGKSTIAAALAVAAEKRGRTVLLAEVEGRHEMERTLGVADPGFHERPT